MEWIKGAVVAASMAASIASIPLEILYGQDGYAHRQDRRAPGERYTPRFDGLRFIETLVTAHK